MPGSILQFGSKASIDAKNAGKEQQTTEVMANLRPIQTTQLWTFDSALSLLRSFCDPYIVGALDQYLLQNSEVLLNPAPFSKTKEEEAYKRKELSLRNTIYTDITDSNLKDAEKLTKLLNLDNKEVLRIVRQTCIKTPERKLTNYEKFRSKLPDDREKYLEEERLLLYTSKILKERRTVLRLVIELLNNKLNPNVSSIVQNLGKDIILSDSYIEKLISSLSSSVESIINKSYLTGISSELDDTIYTETILFIIESLKVLVELLISNNLKKETVFKWFEFMNSTNFLLSLGPHISFTESFALIQGIVTVLTIQVLDIDNDLDTSDLISYLNDGSTFKFINEVILDSENSNTILLFTWGIILLKKKIILEDALENNNKSSTSFIEQISLENINLSINHLSNRVSTVDVFSNLSKLDDLLKFDNIYASILSTLILSILPLVSATPDICSTISQILRNAPNSMIQRFFDNEAAESIIILSRAKFPILLSPYLRIASINGNFAFHEFQELRSYISLFNKSEFNRLYDIDSDNTDLIKLNKSIDLFPPFEVNQKLSLVLNKDTKGKLLPAGNQDQVLVTFLYNFNGWAFLGRVLQNVSKIFDNSDKEKVDFITDILTLLNKVVEDNSPDEAKLAFEAMSAFTDDSDIIEVIIRLFEQALHSRNIDMLEPLITLLSNVMPFLSYRIWPCLSKSSLLSDNGKEGFAATIFGAIEMVKGDYKFTTGLIRLVDALVQNCLSLDEDYPIKSKSAVLSRFVGHLILVFESFIHCRFNEGYQKLEVGVLILDIFSNILINVYGIDEESAPNEKVTKVFADASMKILDSFLVTNSDYSRSSFPIISMIDSITKNSNVYELCDISGFWYETWIHRGLTFAQQIITIRSALGYFPSTFEKDLFSKLPLLVTAYAQRESLRKNVLDLIIALTTGKWEHEPIPSLLSHLGRDHAQILLHSLASDLDNVFDDYKMKISLYDFICAVMDGNQEGLSVLFISGRDVFGEFTNNGKKDKEDVKPISLLNTLKKNVNDMKYYPTDVSLHLVDAIALAFNSWTTVRESENDVEFIKELIDRSKRTTNKALDLPEGYRSFCYNLKLISKITEILSLFLFTTKNDKCKNLIIEYITSNEFIDSLEDRFSISDYQPSLHLHAQESFENTFSGLRLSQFTAALPKRNRLGLHDIYNFNLMQRLFAEKKDWPLMRDQLIASSLNLQYMNAQIAVAKSSGALLTAFCKKVPGQLKAGHLKFVSNLLSINVTEGIPAEFFREIYQERIETAFYLLYSIHNVPEIKKDPTDVFEIIKCLSELLSSSTMDFLNKLTGESVSYKSLLRMVYISLNLIKNEFTLIIEYFSVFHDLFGLLITKGTRNILIDLQNDVYLSRTNKNHISHKLGHRLDDLQLLFSILKVFMSLKSSPSLQNSMASLVIENGTIKSLLNLYSFSHLIEVNNEHIFAQLSLMFIQQLLTVDIIAEHFVSTGLLVVLVQSSISQPIKNGGISISNAPQYHRIWTNGILPTYITILAKLGPKVILELCLALQAFGKQIEFCIESWAKDSSSISISSALVAETSQILLVFQMLKSSNFKEYLETLQDRLPGINSTGQNSVDMPILPGLDTEAKRDDFVDCINNLIKHPKFLSSRIVPSSIEEVQIIEKGDVLFSRLAKVIVEEIRELKEFFSTD